MGFFSGTRVENPEQYIQDFLFPEETVECTYKLINDFVILTSKRVIFIDRSFLFLETIIRSIPYHKIDSISVERNKKLFSVSSVVKITTWGREYKLKIRKGEDVMDFYNTLARYVCEGVDSGVC